MTPEELRHDGANRWLVQASKDLYAAGLGLGELGALTVARFHTAILVTNDNTR